MVKIDRIRDKNRNEERKKEEEKEKGKKGKRERKKERKKKKKKERKERKGEKRKEKKERQKKTDPRTLGINMNRSSFVICSPTLSRDAESNETVADATGITQTAVFVPYLLNAPTTCNMYHREGFV